MTERQKNWAIVVGTIVIGLVIAYFLWQSFQAGTQDPFDLSLL